MIQFREPYVDDKLIWKEPKNKKKGYTLKKGKKELTIDEILSKKNNSFLWVNTDYIVVYTRLPLNKL